MGTLILSFLVLVYFWLFRALAKSSHRDRSLYSEFLVFLVKLQNIVAKITVDLYKMKQKPFIWFCYRAVTESINQLITLCTQQAPGQKECDNALRELEVHP